MEKMQLTAIESFCGAGGMTLGLQGAGFDVRVRGELQQTVRALDALRRLFKRGLDEGRIRHCQCGQPDCPTFMVEPSAAAELDRERTQMLDRVNRIIPHFDVRID